MFKEQITKGLLVSAVALSLSSSFASAQPEPAGGVIAAAAAQLAAVEDSFQATSANLDVAPANMSNTCPQAFAITILLGSQSAGDLSYKIVTEDGRESQVFEARAEATEDGLFAAQATHKVALTESEATEEDPSIVVFDLPAKLKQREPDFFERLFGTGPAADDAAIQGLRNQAFQVQVVAPNALASGFDRHSTSCEEQRQGRLLPASFEDQHDGGGGRDRGDPGGGGDGSGTDGGGRDRDTAGRR